MKTHKVPNSNKTSKTRRIKKTEMKRKALERCSRRNSRDTLKVKGIEQNSNEDSMLQLPGIPLAPSNQNMNPGITFVLEKASLVPAYVGKILNPEIHADFLRKKNMDPYRYRPDIVHEYNYCKRPRVKAKGRRDTLLRVVQNPLAQHLPANSVKIGLSVSSQKSVQLREYVSAISDKANLVFVFGAMAHGQIDSEYVDDFISVSGYRVGVCLRSICIALERESNIL